MRLSTIKLAGFKSFVDPTTLHLPTNMTGIVGPNGCGKSNIIDAVRWVMGESSASRLRGDLLTDVIFSGSSARKPVSQAMVELVFDNSDQAIGGEFAKYNEVSVKRTVSRDGQSIYHLNGARCRRRDITDLFLGTGLGPRSYSIIEQGMISQVVEAKPEDLRLFLEEAAGISKYKERRKETETRIRGTRDNLDRLNDLREEIDKQIEQLRRQARAAEQYQTLQAEHREKEAQSRALEHRRLAAALAALQGRFLAGEAQLQALMAEQREAEAEVELAREQHAAASQQLGRIQAESYRIGGELARVDQQIQHQRELRQRLETARREADAALAEIDRHIAVDQGEVADLQESIAEAEPRLAALRESDGNRQDALREVEQRLSDWQQRWDAYAHAHAEASRHADVERTKVEFLERQVLDANRRREAALTERSALDTTALADALSQLQAEHDARRMGMDGLADALEQKKSALLAVQDTVRQQQADLAELRKSTQALRGRLASLEALQHAALGQEKNVALEWLRGQGLADAPRLGEILTVEPGWETAVEVVLGSLLEAVTVADPTAFAEALGALSQGRVALLSEDGSDIAVAPDSLAAKVGGPRAARALLADVFVVPDLDAAKHRLSSLGDGQALVTPAGEWLGPGWLRALRSGEAQQGALRREREINEIRGHIAAAIEREQALVALQAQTRDAVLLAEQQREDAQRGLYLAHRGVSELAGQIQGHQGKLESAQARATRLDDELGQLVQVLERGNAEIREVRGRLEAATERMGALEAERIDLDVQRRQLGDLRESSRLSAREARDGAHQLALALEAQRTRLSALSQSLARLDTQRLTLLERRDALSAQLAEGDSPVLALQGERQLLLEQRVLVEKDLSAARGALEDIETSLRGMEQRRHARDAQALAQRDAQGTLRLEMQSVELRAAQQAEAIAASGLELDVVLAGLPAQATAEGWAKSIADLEARMRRLEPVNLAAIQQFAEQSERKAYLDAQNADLVAALEQLEDAIRRIDRETRGRFKETFDRVNAGVQELYPRLFGGGHAYLELTGEDLLDTGVAIMARPPGKRVSNISLLSGGEKALTAVALVFAIFRLNPAPFCLLDEVDAPLDEANVGRFCAMVEEMSERVQFLFVSHNKATMEAARQLAGVTMREPGVSRLVSVDLAEATRLAGAA